MVIQLLKRIGSTIFLTRAPAHKMEVMFTHEELISRGFEYDAWAYEGESFEEYKLTVGELEIEISGITLLEISVGGGNWTTVPNCRTVADLDNLIKLFTV